MSYSKLIVFFLFVIIEIVFCYPKYETSPIIDNNDKKIIYYDNDNDTKNLKNVTTMTYYDRRNEKVEEEEEGDEIHDRPARYGFQTYTGDVQVKFFFFFFSNYNFQCCQFYFNGFFPSFR